MLQPRIELKFKGVNHGFKGVQNHHGNRAFDATLFQQRRQVLAGIGIRHVRREEIDGCRIFKNEFPRPLAQHRPNQDIGIQNDSLVAHATVALGFLLGGLAGLRTVLN